MTAAETTGGTTLAIQMRAVFLELARQEDECAAVEAAAQPTGSPAPPPYRSIARLPPCSATEPTTWRPSSVARSHDREARAMNCHVTTVPRSELGLALCAISLGGGTVTATYLSADTVEITYVTRGDRSRCVIADGPPGGSRRPIASGTFQRVSVTPRPQSFAIGSTKPRHCRSAEPAALACWSTRRSRRLRHGSYERIAALRTAAVSRSPATSPFAAVQPPKPNARTGIAPSVRHTGPPRSRSMPIRVSAQPKPAATSP